MHHTNPPFGISLMIAAMMFNATKDGIAKMLVASYTSLTILFIQFTIISLILAPMAIVIGLLVAILIVLMLK
ncbi:MAG: hypothetical protein QF503_08380 [Rhodospirillales bacterium]|jgi:hypothetical protein|nr:hypothetical protein [Rhodospirillales bacterium]|tara:strand:- start:174 stop:389 length:216 start_codon:yes stop_codon:yes gene_type:complete